MTSKADLFELIGAIAESIRSDWMYDVEERIEYIRAIYKAMGYSCPFIDEDAAIYDGRWFRDSWEGPYGMSDIYDDETQRSHLGTIVDTKITEFRKGLTGSGK